MQPCRVFGTAQNVVAAMPGVWCSFHIRKFKPNHKVKLIVVLKWFLFMPILAAIVGDASVQSVTTTIGHPLHTHGCSCVNRLDTLLSIFV